MTNPPATSKLRLGWVMTLTSTAYFMVVLDSTVLITALPSMQRGLRAGLSSLQWTFNAYGIAFAAGIITAAALGDRFGRRRVFNCGLALFTFASAARALAPNAGELIAARTVQGLGGAVVLPLSLTILTTAFPARRRGMIVGVYGGVAGLAVALGPVVGGLVTEAIDWHWIFWLGVPIGIVATLLGLRLLPESYGASQRLDLVGVGLISAGALALVWALTRAGDIGSSSGETPITLAVGVALLAAFFATPMLISPLAGALSDRIGRRAIMVSGLTMQAIGFTWVAARGSLHTSWIELTLALLVAGIGISMALPTVPTAVLSAVCAEEMGKASGINYMAQRFGAVFAIALASAVFSATGHLGTPASVTAGFKPALWTCAALALLAAISAAAIPTRTSAPAGHLNTAESTIPA
jgi:MFS family permease